MWQKDWLTPGCQLMLDKDKSLVTSFATKKAASLDIWQELYIWGIDGMLPKQEAKSPQHPAIIEPADPIGWLATAKKEADKEGMVGRDVACMNEQLCLLANLWWAAPTLKPMCSSYLAALTTVGKYSLARKYTNPKRIKGVNLLRIVVTQVVF